MPLDADIIGMPCIKPRSSKPSSLALRIGACIWCGILDAAITSASASPYAVKQLIVPGAAEVVANHISDSGLIAGAANHDGRTDLVLWDQGRPTLFSAPGAVNNFAVAMNNSGQMVVLASFSRYAHDTYIWNPGTGFVDLDTPEYSVGPVGLNDLGQVVGAVRSVLDPSEPAKAFLWDATDGLHILMPRNAEQYYAEAINNLGQIVGNSVDLQSFGGGSVAQWNHAVMWEHGNLVDLTPDVDQTAGRYFSSAMKINNRGQVLGDRDTLKGWVISVHDPVLGEVILPNSAGGWESDINDAGQVVGVVPDGSMTNTHAALWKDYQFHDLNDLIEPGNGWVLTEANDINNFGQIVGVGYLNGQFSSFLLTPTPEPSGVIILFASTFLLGRRRRKVVVC